MYNEWIMDIISEFVPSEEIRTTAENMEKSKNYFITQGYCESLGIVCAALIADSKTKNILLSGIAEH